MGAAFDDAGGFIEARRPDPVLLGDLNSDSSDCSIEEFYVIDYNYEGKGKGQRRHLRPISPLPAAMKVPDFLPAIAINNRITDCTLPRTSCSSHRAPPRLLKEASRIHSCALLSSRRRKPLEQPPTTTKATAAPDGQLKLKDNTPTALKSVKSKTEYYLKENKDLVTIFSHGGRSSSVASEDADYASLPRSRRKTKRPETFTITRSGKGDGYVEEAIGSRK